MTSISILRKRHGITGLETAIILVAFVITAAAFAFVVLNLGFLTAEKAQSVISSGMTEVSSSILMDSGMVGQFENVTGPQSSIGLIKLTFYIKLSQGHEPVNLSSDKLVAIYTNARCHGTLYSSAVANGTIMTVKGVNSDGDDLIETGEKFKVTVDFTALTNTAVDPAQPTQDDLYVHPYEEFRIELRPAKGAALAIERQLPVVYSTVITIE